MNVNQMYQRLWQGLIRAARRGKTGRGHPRGGRRPGVRLQIESLETRVVPSMTRAYSVVGAVSAVVTQHEGAEAGSLPYDLPVGSTIQQAFLYDELGNFPAFSAQPVVNFGGFDIASWTDLRNPDRGNPNDALRADVTSIVRGAIPSGGSGSIPVAPVATPVGTTNAQELLIIYSNPSLPRGQVVVMDGNLNPAGDSVTMGLAASVGDPTDRSFSANLIYGITPDLGDEAIQVNGQSVTTTGGVPGTAPTVPIPAAALPRGAPSLTITANDPNAGREQPDLFLLAVTQTPLLNALSVTADRSALTAPFGGTASNTGTFFDTASFEVSLTASAGTITGQTPGAAGTWAWSEDGVTSDRTVTITATAADGQRASTTFQVSTGAPSVPTVAFSVDGETMDETRGRFNLPVVLSQVSSRDVILPFTLGGTATPGIDYRDVTASPLIVRAGQLTAAITGTLIDDGIPDAGETVSFTLGRPVNAEAGGIGVNILTITEPPTALKAQFATASETIDATSGSFSIPIVLSAPNREDVSIPFTVGGTAVYRIDYNQITASPLVIHAGQTTGAITGLVVPNPGPSRTLTFTMGQPRNADLGTITDNTLIIGEPATPPTVEFNVPGETRAASAGTFGIRVHLSHVAGQDVTVPFTLTGTARADVDYLDVTPSPLVIPAGQTFTDITGNLLPDPGTSPTLTLTLGRPTGADLGANTTNTLAITEPVPATVQFSQPGQVVNETDGTFRAAVNLTNVPAPGAVSTFAAGFRNPVGIALDANENVYVSDSDLGTVSKITADGRVSTYASGLGTPGSLAFDSLGNLYIADATANTVSKVTPAGVATLFLSSAGGLRNPRALAFDASDNLYIANAGDGTVLKATAGGIATFATGFVSPSGLTITPSNSLFVSDPGDGKITRIERNGREVSPVIGLGSPMPLTVDANGSVHVAVNTGSGTSVSVISRVGAFEFHSNVFASGLNETAGIAFDSAGNLYAANPRAGTVSKVRAPLGLEDTDILDHQLGRAFDMTVDPDGNLYLAESSVGGSVPVGSVTQVTPAGDVRGLPTGVEGAKGVAFDTAGNLFVANPDEGTVSKVTPAGVASTFASGFAQPTGLAFDGAGNLYVGNAGDGTVSKVTPAGVVRTFASGFDGLQLNLAFDTAGNLYVANEAAGTISKVTPAGVATTFASGFRSPYGLAFDGAGNLHVANHRDGSVSKVTPAGVVSTFASGLAEPTGLTFDASGMLYVAGNNGALSRVTPAGVVSPFVAIPTDLRVLTLDRAGNFYFADTSAGTVSKMTPQGVISMVLTGLDRPTRLAVDAANNLYVASSGMVTKVTTAGRVSTFASGLAPDIAGLAVDAAGNVYVTDKNAGSVNRITPDGRISVFVAGFIAPSRLAFDPFGNLYVESTSTDTISRVTPDGVVSVALRLGRPTGLTFDSAGNMYVIDSLHGFLEVVSPTGVAEGRSSTIGFDIDIAVDGNGNVYSFARNSVLNEATAGHTGWEVTAGLIEAAGLAFNAAGDLYVSSLQGVARVTPGGVLGPFVNSLLYTVGVVRDARGNLYVSNVNNGTVGMITAAGEATTIATGLNMPTGLALDSAGNVYVANHGASTVSKISPAGVVSTFAAGIPQPTGLAFDAEGNLYVAGGGTMGRISKVTRAGEISTLANGFDFPFALAFDAAGNLYVTTADRVNKVTPGGVVSTFAAGITHPTGLAFDAAGHLYVATGHGQLYRFTLGTTVPITAGGTAVAGVDYSSLTASPLVIPFGQTSATITGTVLDDHLFDPASRALVLTLGTPTGATLGQTTTHTVTFLDVNNTPTFTASSRSVMVDEGSAARNTGTFADLDRNDRVTITASVGTIAQDVGAAGSWRWSFDAGDGPAQGQPVTITASDGHGGVATTTFTLVVNNVAPTASLRGDGSGVRGQQRTFVLGATDPSPVDRAAGFVWAIDWRDGSPLQTVTGAAGKIVMHTFAETGSYAVAVTATDKDGLTGPGATQAVGITAWAVQIDAQDGKRNLVVGGGGHDSTVKVDRADRDEGPGALVVKIDDRQTGRHELKATVAGPIDRVILFGQKSDLLSVDEDVKADAELYAGPGNSTLRGGGGNNLLVGGDGDDLLHGGSVRDILIGGSGKDELRAGSGQDILVAGRTSFDRDGVALRALLLEWASQHDYLVRVRNLTNYQGMDGLNGAYFLNTRTVQDDASVDNLKGGSGQDWFIAHTSGQAALQDRLTGARADEVVTSI